MRVWPIALATIAGVAAVATGLGMESERTVGAYATPLEGRTRNQRHNTSLSLKRLRGAIVQPGEVFSFNKRVGTLSQDAGFRKAPVSYNGQLIDSWGGGVCQTSTTLYNAALLAGMEIVERSRHRFAPGYVPPGLDAAVAFDNIDLKFRNTLDKPIRIDGDVNASRILIRIVSSAAPGPKPEIQREVRSQRDPQSFVLKNQGGRFGRVRNTGKAGCEVAVYRVVDGKREFISLDKYPAMNRIIEYR